MRPVNYYALGINILKYMCLLMAFMVGERYGQSGESVLCVIFMLGTLGIFMVFGVTYIQEMRN